MPTLTDLIDRVEAELKAAANGAWSADDLTGALRRALQELSEALPRRAAVSFAAQAGCREYSLAVQGISDCLYLVEVWHPYDAAAPEHPPRAVPWRLLDDDTLFLAVDTIHGGQGVRVLYACPHTIEGLDGAATTTLSAAQVDLVCLGAAGHAAVQRAQEAIGQVNIVGQAPQLWLEWGQARLAACRSRLDQLALRQAQAAAAWTGGWELGS